MHVQYLGLPSTITCGDIFFVLGHQICPVSDRHTLPYSSITSTYWAMQVIVFIALITVNSYFHRILHSLQCTSASMPPLFLTAKKMIPAPISEGMKLQLREGSDWYKVAQLVRGHRRDSLGPLTAPSSHSNRRQEKKVFRSPDSRFLHLSWGSGVFLVRGGGLLLAQYHSEPASECWAQTVRYCLVDGRILSFPLKEK